MYNTQWKLHQHTLRFVLQKMTACVMVRVSYRSHNVSNFHSSRSTATKNCLIPSSVSSSRLTRMRIGSVMNLLVISSISWGSVADSSTTYRTANTSLLKKKCNVCNATCIAVLNEYWYSVPICCIYKQIFSRLLYRLLNIANMWLSENSVRTWWWKHFNICRFGIGIITYSKGVRMWDHASP